MNKNPFDSLKLKSYLLGQPPKKGGIFTVTPFFMADCHYDTYDIRSTVKQSADFTIGAPFIDLGSDITWIPEMLFPVDRNKLVPLPSDGLRLVAPNVEVTLDLVVNMKDSVKRTLLHYHRIKTLHNPELNLYSKPFEKHEEFLTRCRRKSRDILSFEMNSLRKKYETELERLKLKFNRISDKGSEKNISFQESQSSIETLLHQATEQLADLFLNLDIDMNNIPFSDFSLEDDETLFSLHEIFQRAIREIDHIKHRIDELANRIEEHIVSLKYNDIEIYQVGILWKRLSI